MNTTSNTVPMNNKEIFSAVRRYYHEHEKVVKQYGKIENWNVSNVTNMDYLFECIQCDFNLSKWNVSNVTSMEGMFKQSEFNYDISDWDVRNVTNMKKMFMYNTHFDQDISKWNLDDVNTEQMFTGNLHKE